MNTTMERSAPMVPDVKEPQPENLLRWIIEEQEVREAEAARSAAEAREAEERARRAALPADAVRIPVGRADADEADTTRARYGYD